jgi:hypothetical protein
VSNEREFWITDHTDDSGYTARKYDGPDLSVNVIHVIEKSAYDRTQARLEIAMEALRNINGWTCLKETSLEYRIHAVAHEAIAKIEGMK